jgi:type II restriction enzyme
MANISFYKNHLGLENTEAILKALTDTLIETNYTYDFFVDWNKVFTNRDSFKYELALLKSLKSSKAPENDLRELLIKYPEVIKVLPILLAYRNRILKIINSTESDLVYKTLDFYKANQSLEDIDNIVFFAKSSGLLNAICRVDSAADYLLGVEVGLDTNARKNRSGLFLEEMVRDSLQSAASSKPNRVIIEQKTFAYIEEKYGIAIPADLRNRRFDFTVIENTQATTIEVNFYGGTGSKPSEIVSSYVNRGQLLESTGWKFVWLTDGIGWRNMQRPLKVGIENISYIINACFLKKGILEKIINEK